MLLVDYTGMLHCRGPKLAGGALFTFQAIVSQCYPFVAALVQDERNWGQNRRGHAEHGVIVLASSWFACMLAFLRVTKKEFWNTFTSTVTCWQFTIDSFRRPPDEDAHRIRQPHQVSKRERSRVAESDRSEPPLTRNPPPTPAPLPQFQPIKEEVKAYTSEHWHEFLGMDWFTRDLFPKFQMSSFLHAISSIWTKQQQEEHERSYNQQHYHPWRRLYLRSRPSTLLLTCTWFTCTRW